MLNASGNIKTIIFGDTVIHNLSKYLTAMSTLMEDKME